MPRQSGFTFSNLRNYFPYLLLLLIFVGVWTGMNWTQSFSIGVLMNTRGLVELVVLNIGYDLGILSGRIFAMMVLMALVTTFMTGPLLSLVRTRN